MKYLFSLAPITIIGALICAGIIGIILPLFNKTPIEQAAASTTAIPEPSALLWEGDRYLVTLKFKDGRVYWDRLP